MSVSSRATDDAAVMEVHLLRLPVPVWAEAQEHGDELIREFALIAGQLRTEGSHADVPVRLTELIEVLTSRYGSLSAAQEAQLADAAERGVPEIEHLIFPAVPVHAAEAAIQIAAILDEADEYCRAGQHLLTLATPPEVVRFRNWYLGEFVRQLAGGAPVPWPDFPG